MFPPSSPPPPPSDESNNEPVPQQQFQQPLPPYMQQRYPGPGVSVVLEEMDQIWVGIDNERRQMTIYLTSEVSNQIGVAPGIFLDEKQVVQFIGMCQGFLRELRKLPLPPRIYP